MARKVGPVKTPTSMLSPDRHNGFTLMEMLVVLVIMSILSGIALSSFTNFAAVDDSKARLEASILQARERAIVTGRPVTIILPAPFSFRPLISGRNLEAFSDGSVTPGSIITDTKPQFDVRWTDGALQQ